MREHKISSVEANNKRHSFAVTIGGGRYEVPYSLAHIEGVIESVAPDGEIGNAGFTWVTRKGGEGTMLAEEVLWIYEDPEVRFRHTLHELTMEARRRQARVQVSSRALARMIRTTNSRVLQLLDPSYQRKSIKQMSKLLAALGAQVEVTVRDRRKTGRVGS